MGNYSSEVCRGLTVVKDMEGFPLNICLIHMPEVIVREVTVGIFLSCQYIEKSSAALEEMDLRGQ